VNAWRRTVADPVNSGGVVSANTMDTVTAALASVPVHSGAAYFAANAINAGRGSRSGVPGDAVTVLGAIANNAGTGCAAAVSADTMTVCVAAVSDNARAAPVSVTGNT
jgi:hypothetical protein